VHRTIVPAVTARFAVELGRHYETLFGGALAESARAFRSGLPAAG
jgi:hypothetical protein